MSAFKYGGSEMTQTESSPDQAYYDRNLVVQLAAKLAIKCGIKAGIRERQGQWPILYIDLPTGQV